MRNKPNSEGLNPIVLRVTKDRKSKLITLMRCNPNEWSDSKGRFKTSTENSSNKNKALQHFLSKGWSIINEMTVNNDQFTVDDFVEKFKGTNNESISVHEFWLSKIDSLIKEGRTGNARAYKDTMTSYFKFQKNKSITFKQIDYNNLAAYESFLRSTGSKDASIAVRMRAIRALYNDAIKKGFVQSKYYPFNDFKISKLKGQPNKRALSRDEMKLFESLDVEKHPELELSKKYFLFSYYTSGMNFNDMMLLKWDNIEGERIKYVRSKTKGRFSIKILDPVREILNYFQTAYMETNYIFPILLEENLTPMQIEYRKAKTLKKFNRDLKQIAEIVGIKKKLTSYVARHSYATNMRELGLSTDIISQSMGHQSVAITSAYLKEFDIDIIDNANEKLILEPPMQYGIGINY